MNAPLRTPLEIATALKKLLGSIRELAPAVQPHAKTPPPLEDAHYLSDAAANLRACRVELAGVFEDLLAAMVGQQVRLNELVREAKGSGDP